MMFRQKMAQEYDIAKAEEYFCMAQFAIEQKLHLELNDNYPALKYMQRIYCAHKEAEKADADMNRTKTLGKQW